MKDSRFEPIRWSEVSQLHCSVSLLGCFEPTDAWDDWSLGQHGIRIQWTPKDRRHPLSATFLPEVPVQMDWSHLETIQNLVKKAGYRYEEALLDSMQVTRYTSSKASASYDEYRSRPKGEP